MALSIEWRFVHRMAFRPSNGLLVREQVISALPHAVDTIVMVDVMTAAAVELADGCVPTASLEVCSHSCT